VKSPRDGLSLIAFKLDPELLEAMDSARGRRGRSEFIREALAATLQKMGVPLSPNAETVPDRVFTHRAKVQNSGLDERSSPFSAPPKNGPVGTGSTSPFTGKKRP